jgi:hypothetical protein
MLGFIRYLANNELSYNLSRPYRFGKWFKLHVLLGFLCVFGFLTVFNLATNGFDKQFRYTSDPNSTESKTNWYNHRFFTWGDDSLDPKCQNAEIPVGHKFITTNRGLQYTVRKIFYHPPGSKVEEQQPSILYHNNVLTNCDVDIISLTMKKIDTAKPDPEYRWWSWMDSSAEAVASCTVVNDDGLFTLEFLVEYDTPDNDYTYMALNNATTHASFWWGSRLMSAYFVGLKHLMSYPITNSTLAFTRAGLNYWRNGTTSMRDPELFRNQFFFIDVTGGIGDIWNAIPDNGGLYNNPSFPQSRPLTEGFFFAKIFRSLILVDLGNTDVPNLLLDPDLLQYALNPAEDDFNRIAGAPLLNTTKVDWFKFNAIPSPDAKGLDVETAQPLDQAYAKFKDQTGPLGTKQASIHVEYICAVPEMKPTSAVVLFTLVATLALFQTAWALFKYILDQRTMWIDPTANMCEGCLANGYGLQKMGREDSRSISVQPAECGCSNASTSTQSLLREENNAL